MEISFELNPILDIYSNIERNSLLISLDKKSISLKTLLLEILEILISNKTMEISIISVEGKSLNNEEIYILNYLSELYFKIINFQLKINCKYGYESCKIKLIQILKNLDNFHSFFSVFSIISNESLIEVDPNKQQCRICLESSKKLEKKLHKVILNSNLTSFFFKKYGIKIYNSDFIINQFHTLKPLFENSKDTAQNIIIENEAKQYFFHNNYFIATIFQQQSTMRHFYKFERNLSIKCLNCYESIKNFIENKLVSLNLLLDQKLGEKIDFLTKNISELVQNYIPDLDHQDGENISLNLALKYLNLHNIFPLLIDPQIEEIFLDEINQFIYINHQYYGKCDTSVKLSKSEINAIKTYISLESKINLDEQHPNLVYVMQNHFFYCRFSLDIFPSHWKNISLDIRKLNKSFYNIYDLLRLKTFNLEIACFLILMIIFRINITIAGEINSGKTTLLNSLDLITPNNFRKIYVEDTIETLEIPFKKSYQLKFINIASENSHGFSKEKDIYKLLHRSGDYIILGEILTENESKALFHCLSVGLRGIQTTHASDLDSLVNRWSIHHNINKICLNDLGIIIIMKKIGRRRIVESISEIFFKPRENSVEKHIFFTFNSKKENWIMNFNLLDSRIFQKITKIINISEDHLETIKKTVIKQLENDFAKNSSSLYNSFQKIYKKIAVFLPSIGQM